jgi:hypothetical protein
MKIPLLVGGIFLLPFPAVRKSFFLEKRLLPR